MNEQIRTVGIPALTPQEDEDAVRRFEKLSGQIGGLSKPHNVPYAPIIQLRRDEFPELPWPEGMDLFQLLWCPRVHFFGNHPALGGQSSGAKILWRTEASIQDPLAVWERSDQQLLYECALNPEEILEYPQACEFGSEMDAWLEHLHSEVSPSSDPEDRDVGPQRWYSYNVATAPGTKLLGHPQRAQHEETPDCRCGERMKLLLTCASQEDAHNTVWNSQPFRRGPDRSPQTLERVDNPFGFVWGGWSNAYVFYCNTGHALECGTLVQTS